MSQHLSDGVGFAQMVPAVIRITTQHSINAPSKELTLTPKGEHRTKADATPWGKPSANGKCAARTADYSLKLQGAIHQWVTRVLNKIEGLIFYPDLHLMLVSGSRLDLLVHRHQPGLGGWIPNKKLLNGRFPMTGSRVSRKRIGSVRAERAQDLRMSVFSFRVSGGCA